MLHSVILYFSIIMSAREAKICWKKHLKKKSSKEEKREKLDQIGRPSRKIANSRRTEEMSQYKVNHELTDKSNYSVYLLTQVQTIR